MNNIVSEKSIQQKSRIDWIDLAKGIGIICVVFGHTQIPYISTYLIYPFHVPLFFFLSGYCLSVKNNFKEFFIKKIKSLLVPYVFFSFVWIIYETINETITSGFSFSFLLNEIKIYIQQDHLHAIWFITCIFLVEILAFLLVSICREKDLFLIIISGAFLVSTYLYKKFVDVGLIWNAEIVLPAMPYFLFGYVVKKRNELFEKITVKKVIPIYLIMYILIGFLNIRLSGQYIDMYSNSYGNILLFYLAAFCGILFVISVSKVINKIEFINYIGKNSLIIFSLHQIIIKIYRNVVSNYEFSSIEFVLGEILIFVVSISVILCFNEIIKKTPFVWFINGCKRRNL